MTGVLIKRKYKKLAIHMGRTPCEDEGRDQGDASQSQGAPTIASKLPEARGEAWKRFSQPLERKVSMLPTL